MEWLDLLAPSAAIVAVFAAIGLVVQSIRHGRAIRRLEERLAERGEAAVDAPLQRIAELQARAQVSAEGGGTTGGHGVRTALGVLAAVALVAVALAGGWFLFLRDDGAPTASADGTTTAATTEAAPAAPPADESLVPAEVPPIADKSLYTVTVFNASGVSGAAANEIAPKVEAEGYTLGLVENPPDGTSDLRQSVVMYAEGRRQVGRNLAKDLGIERAGPIDGITTEQSGGADAVVLVGRDLAGTP
jgi:hypothetical protein